MSHDSNITGSLEEIEFQKSMSAFKGFSMGQGQTPFVDEPSMFDQSADLNIKQFKRAFLDILPGGLDVSFSRRGPF